MRKNSAVVSKIIMKADSSTARNFTDLKLNKRKETHELRGVQEGGKSKGQRPRYSGKKYNSVSNINH